MTTQSLQALQVANDVKARRMAMRRDLQAGELRLDDVLLGDWPCLKTALVGDVLTWAPRVGRVSSEAICRRAAVPYGREVGTLTGRQRRALVEAIAYRRPGVLA